VINHLPALVAELEEKIGKKVRQQDIADGAGITQTTLSRYINTYSDSARFDVEFKLCQFFTKELGRPINRGDLFSFDLGELEAS